MSSNGSAPTTPVPPAHGPVLTAEPDEQGRRQRSRRPPTSAPAVAPAKTRRRSGVLAAGLALVVVGALGAAYLTQVVGDTVQVVAVARDVQPGELIERTDLTVADVSVDPALTPVPAARLTELVGQRAAVALSAGSLLTDAAVSEQVLPAAGQSLVGVALQSAQLPAEPLQAGDRIRIVDTPASQGEPPASTPQTIPAVVVSVAAPDDSGQTIVNVTVPSGQAADLAARVATGRIALILDSRER
jgi:flagella basal body P-ring formation protein FlgA